MRASRFNKIVCLENGKKLLFNAYSGAIAELPPETCGSVEKILSSPESAQSVQEKEHRDHLIYGGFLVDENVDELTKLRVENERYRFGGSAFSLGIAPTLECNLACTNCSSRQSRGRMSGLIAKQLIDFASGYIRRCVETQITWFGGEPLLCIETIEKVQRGISESANKHGISLSGKIITNGLLLDGDMARRLRAVGVSSAQVTLGGTAKTHDLVRGTGDGKGTYEKIIANVSDAAETLDIVIRVNIERDSIEDARDLVEFLDGQGLLSRVGFYFGESVSNSQICSDAVGRCKLSERHTTTQLRLYRELAERVGSRIDFPYLLPVKRCSAVSDSSFIVAPTGYLFKCWEEVSMNVDKSVGSIFADDQEPFQLDNHWRFAGFEPFLYSDCTQCGILPLCMGGCAAKSGNGFDANQCSPLRDKLSELLLTRYLYEVREEVI